MQHPSNSFKRLRRLVLQLGAVGLSTPLAALSQGDGKMWRIGFLGLRQRPSARSADVYYDAFVDQLLRLGYVEGRNCIIEGRYAGGEYQRLPELAAELVRLKVDVIVTHGTPGPKAALGATRTIPVVGLAAIDPVGSGFAASLSRPGRNFTGLSLVGVDVSQKQLELLKTLRPQLSAVAVLANPENPAHKDMSRVFAGAATTRGIKVIAAEASTPDGIDAAFGTLARARAEAVVILADAFYIGRFTQLSQLATKKNLPSIAPWREYVVAGGLMSYGQNLSQYYRRGAEYVDRILKGANPAEMPIEQPTNLHLAINLRTAKILQISVPAELLFRADEQVQ